MNCERCNNIVDARYEIIYTCSLCKFRSFFDYKELTLGDYCIEWREHECCIITKNKDILIMENIPYNITEEKFKMILTFI